MDVTWMRVVRDGCMESAVKTARLLESFMRIPGIGDEPTHTTLALNGSVVTLNECVAQLDSPDSDIRHRAMLILEEVSSPSRSEMHAICSALLQAINRNDQDLNRAESSLIHFIGLHKKSLESLNIGAQLLLMWGSHAAGSSSRQAFVDLLNHEIRELRFSSDRHSIVATRYVLFRSFETLPLRAAAALAIQAILEDSSAPLLVERKAFAGQFLSFLRSVPNCESAYDGLRVVATSVFATGNAPKTATLIPQIKPFGRSSATPIASRVTSQDASSSLAPEARALIDRLLADSGGLTIARLGPQDYELLRRVHGLSLDEFRGITDKIRFKAASDPWARAAILDLVRAPHEAAVSHGVRTAVLGALVNDARKVGKLSSKLEKEVFAISAELPALQLSSYPQSTTLDSTKSSDRPDRQEP